MTEEWRDVVGFEGIYQISNLGNVKRIKIPWNRKALSGKNLRQSQGRDHYLRVTLYLPSGDPKIFFVSRVVAMAFLGPPQGDKIEVNHKNGIRDDNRVENLEWVTRSENHYHANRILRRYNAHGEKHYKTKLTDDNVREIRRAYAAGEQTRSQLAHRFGIAYSNVWSIITRKRWAHINDYA